MGLFEKSKSSSRFVNSCTNTFINTFKVFSLKSPVTFNNEKRKSQTNTIFENLAQ